MYYFAHDCRIRQKVSYWHLKARKGFESMGFQTAMIFGYIKLLSKKKCIFQDEGNMAQTQKWKKMIIE
jgi:hypothetical protein